MRGKRAGWDPIFGGRLPGLLRGAGLDGVRADGRRRLIRGGTDETAFFRLSICALRQKIVANGALTDLEIEESLGKLDEPDRIFVSPAMVAACGWRRAHDGFLP